MSAEPSYRDISAAGTICIYSDNPILKHAYEQYRQALNHMVATAKLLELDAFQEMTDPDDKNAYIKGLMNYKTKYITASRERARKALGFDSDEE